MMPGRCKKQVREGAKSKRYMFVCPIFPAAIEEEEDQQKKSLSIE